MANLSGKILGMVTDSAGVPQMGAVVLLLNREDKPCDRLLTDPKGTFSFEGVTAFVYSIHVSLARSGYRRARFRATGLDSQLSLAGLFGSIQSYIRRWAAGGDERRLKWFRKTPAAPVPAAARLTPAPCRTITVVDILRHAAGGGSGGR
jgi:hypothetical protein